MTVQVLPDSASICEFMEIYACSRERAIKILQDNDNDLERAKIQYAVLKRYLGNSEPARSHSRTPSTVSSHHDHLALLDYDSTTEDEDEDESYESELSCAASKQSLTSPVDSSTVQSPVYINAIDKEPAFDKPEVDNDSALAIPLPTASNDATASQTHDSLRSAETDSNDPWPWDFMLPKLPDVAALGSAQNASFDPVMFSSSIQQGAKMQDLRNYLDQFTDSSIRKRINDKVEGFPLIFYVVQANNEGLLRQIVARGGNPEAVHGPSGIPLLAYAIVNSQTATGDKTLLVATLLSLGVPASTIPPAFYTPYLQDLPEAGPERFSDEDSESKEIILPRWCTSDVQRALAATMTLSQRYFLEKAAGLRGPTPRETDLAERRNAEGLLGIPYFLIGQSLASRLLLRKLLSHILSPSKRPLVLVFAGPSGHGKTELARRLGHLLSLELEVVDCTAFSREIELFGPREPYVGAEKGSPLNNFLAKHDGQRCIVFLDEFEKTTQEIHKTLLLPFDNGEYQDRRTRGNINCSNTIWILATNAHDAVIQDFYQSNEAGLMESKDKDESERLTKKLVSEVRSDFLKTFGPPLTGRISAFIPFLPFSVGEQAVIIHKYLMELGESVEGAVDLSRGPKEKLLGNVRLQIRRDASVCQLLAQGGYNTHLGARSLISAVDMVKSRLIEEYLEINKGFSEDPVKTSCVVDVRSGEIVVSMLAPK